MMRSKGQCSALQLSIFAKDNVKSVFWGLDEDGRKALSELISFTKSLEGEVFVAVSR
jgi:hypothetical protein